MKIKSALLLIITYPPIYINNCVLIRLLLLRVQTLYALIDFEDYFEVPCKYIQGHIMMPCVRRTSTLSQEVSSCCLRNAEVPGLNLTNTPYFCMSIGCFWCGGNIIKKVFNKIMFGKLLYKFPTFVYNFRVAVHIMYLCTHSRYKYLGLLQWRIWGGLWQDRCIQSIEIC